MQQAVIPPPRIFQNANAAGLRDTMSQRGNALFLILIAVALFAALGYAITQSGRGGGNITNQTALITAGQVSEAPADIRSAVSRMVLSGVSGTSLIYLHTSSTADAAVNVFTQPLGGGAVDVAPPTAACNAAIDCNDWAYIAAQTAAICGNYVVGLGTEGTGGSDAFAVLGAGCGGIGDSGNTGTPCGADTIAWSENGGQGITQTVCTAIQKGLGFASPYTPPKLVTLVDWGRTGTCYNGAGSLTTVHDTGDVTTAQDFACVQNYTSNIYNYYAVLLDQ
jgi:hypothetical protein